MVYEHCGTRSSSVSTFEDSGTDDNLWIVRDKIEDRVLRYRFKFWTMRRLRIQWLDPI